MVQNELPVIDSEFLQKLLYVDILFSKYTQARNKPLTDDELDSKLRELKQIAHEKTITQIRDELYNLNPSNIGWFQRYAHVEGNWFEIDPNVLCVDDFHSPAYGPRGTLLSDLINHNVDSTEQERRLFVIKHFMVLSTHIPIIIRRYGDLYEVLSGNHRSLAAIYKELCPIRCILVTERS